MATATEVGGGSTDKSCQSIKSNIGAQLDEIELLESIYSKPGEFIIEDNETYLQAEAYINGSSNDHPCTLTYTIHLALSIDEDDDCIEVVVDICCRNKYTYPSMSLPDVNVRSDNLSRCEQDQLNMDMKEYLTNEMVFNDVCVHSLVEWVKDNLINYCSPSQLPSTAATPTQSGCHGDRHHFCRMWLYMHHIYSKIKRRNILSLTKDYELSGFCLPGKPGVVCVEGTVHNTNEFYGLLRRWNWKSITCRKREVIPITEKDEIKHYHKFQGFRELSFNIHGPRGNHLDLGQFKKYLTDHNLDSVFKDLFGV